MESAQALSRTTGPTRSASPRPHVLIVTHDELRAAPWLALLRRKRFRVGVAASYLQARALTVLELPDMLLLDLADDDDGALHFCRHLRAAGAALPVLMLHPLGTPDDLRTGMEAGADVYLRGWCAPEEVLGHLQRLRRAANPAASGGAGRRSAR